MRSSVMGQVAGVLILWTIRDALQGAQIKQDCVALGKQVEMKQECFIVTQLSGLVYQVFSALAAAAVLLWRVRSETASAEAAADDPTGKGNRGFSKLPTSVVGRTGGVEAAGDSVPLVYRYLAAVVFAAASAGLSGISMTTADEVLRVGFDATKLVPALAVATVLGNTSYPWSDYGIAVVIVAGLVVFLTSEIAAVTATVSASEPWVGPVALSVAVLVDAVLPNIEELILRRYGRAAEELMLFTQGPRAIVSLIFVASSVDSSAARAWFSLYGSFRPLSWLLLQAAVAYASTYLYLHLLMTAGSKVTVITTSCRGVVARSLSSLLFLRPWVRREAFGAMLLLVGLAADGRWGTPDDHPPAPRRPGTGRIIDVSGIMLPFAFVGKLHTLTMDRMTSSPLSGARRSLSGTILDPRRDKM